MQDERHVTLRRHFRFLEVQEVLARRLPTVPAGAWTGCHLGWHYVQLAENRPPTKAELDDVAPNNPVFLSGRAGHVEQFFQVTNTLGQKFFESLGFLVDNVQWSYYHKSKREYDNA